MIRESLFWSVGRFKRALSSKIKLAYTLEIQSRLWQMRFPSECVCVCPCTHTTEVILRSASLCTDTLLPGANV